ncbi:unnamed protein product [Strongylus vulgaris]|uniref:Uncharacterized protein n=1 Tax=Strongylus vulgaris TaxID=40348 RepID=A0A3P7JGX9_STRVU|nr:unnamed protein product [Strongylus vulgaris]
MRWTVRGAGSQCLDLPATALSEARRPVQRTEDILTNNKTAIGSSSWLIEKHLEPSEQRHNQLLIITF